MTAGLDIRGLIIMFRTALAATAGLAALAGSAFAQDLGASPTYGSVSLNAGFTPDPYSVSLQSGGSIDAGSALGGSCRGFIASAPDFSVNYSAGGWPLIISATSNADTALVVNDANGNWYCDDDSGGNLNPAINFSNPPSGRYDIWVATYGNASLQAATLHISEVGSQ